jgi:SAM-dependent methyltransferase
MHGADAAEQQRLEAQARLLGGAEFLPPLRPGMQLLDIGCGTGAIARDAARAVHPGLVLGLDRSEAQLATAARLAAAHGIMNVQFRQADALHLQLPDDTYDGVYCRFVLEHLARPKQAVREMYRVIRPGGWACAYEWEAGCIVNYPDSPAIDQVWHTIYRWQQAQGGDPWIGRKLYGIFTDVGFAAVHAECRGWAITGAPEESERLRWYVGGACEIMRQTSAGLIAAQLVTPETLARADDEYQRLLTSPATYIAHSFCRVVGFKGERG